jgi:hypothetical protein
MMVIADQSGLASSHDAFGHSSPGISGPDARSLTHDIAESACETIITPLEDQGEAYPLLLFKAPLLFQEIQHGDPRRFSRFGIIDG